MIACDLFICYLVWQMKYVYFRVLETSKFVYGNKGENLEGRHCQIWTDRRSEVFKCFRNKLV